MLIALPVSIIATVYVLDYAETGMIHWDCGLSAASIVRFSVISLVLVGVGLKLVIGKRVQNDS